jgi:NAD(P)H-dependent FMN reductase
MKISIISGSTRVGSQSLKVANYISNFLISINCDSVVVDLATLKIKEWDQSFWSNEEFDHNWTIVKHNLEDSDAIVVVAPEWDGSIPSGLKNFFHLATKGEIANKPALIVSVSAGPNGVYPVTELRSSCYKNSFVCYIPQHVIVRFVNDVLNDFNNYQNDNDKEIRNRLNASLKVLSEYASALRVLRNSDAIRDYSYPYGM